MNAPARPTHPGAAAATPPTVMMRDGWHCLHLYYRIRSAVQGINSNAQRSTLGSLTRSVQGLLFDKSRSTEAGKEFCQILDPKRPGAPTRLCTSVVMGHKADLAVLAMDENPLVLDNLKHAIRDSQLGSLFELVYSYVSITEISEYVPTLEQYGDRLKAEGNDPASPAFAAKLKMYEDREVIMRKQRLFPDFPDWPVLCFYPMNKARHPHANWYTLPYSQRMEMMTEHGKSGMKFGGRVMQVITASTGLDDWEWGVTLWGKEPAYIKEIVYTMRFDEASANYGEFGPFYLSYIMTPDAALRQLKVLAD